MTVRELKKLLEQHPDDMPVLVCASHEGYSDVNMATVEDMIPNEFKSTSREGRWDTVYIDTDRTTATKMLLLWHESEPVDSLTWACPLCGRQTGELYCSCMEEDDSEDTV